MGRVKAELVDGMYVVGDLGYLPEEWERLERRRAQQRDYYRRNREARLAAVARWHRANRDRVREIRRESARRRRQEARGSMRIVASLHDLACAGPTKPTGCRCHKILIVREARAA